MAVEKRPYYIVHKGQQHMVEAVSPAVAVQHVVGTEITDLRVARPAEVLAWVRAGKPVDVAGVKPAQTPLLEHAGGAADQDAHEVAAVFTFDDVREWYKAKWNAGDHLTSQKPQLAAAMLTFDAIFAEGAMSLSHFNSLTETLPEFGAAICKYAASVPGTLAQVRESIDNDPMTVDDLVSVIGDASRDELFEPEAAKAE